MKKEKGKKKKNPNDQFDFAVGGQALIEGIMMRSPNFITVALRKPNGEILLTEEKFVPFAKRLNLHKIPIIRGMIGLGESLYLGTKFLNYSSKVAMEEIEEKGKRKKEKEKMKEKSETAFEIILVIFSYIFSIFLGLFLFKYVPLLIAESLQKHFPIIAENYIYYNAIDGVTKITLFVAYIFLISLLPDIKRVFQYHGAEHKSIMAYENNLDLNVENALKQTRFHPRCGTSFIFFVLFLSIFIYTVIPTHDEFYTKLVERIALLPLIAGVSFEALKLTAKYRSNFFINLLTKPGLAFQRITTKEPDSKEQEVALMALKRAIELERGR